MRQHRTVILPSFATIFLCSLLLTASFVVFGGVVRVLSMEKNLYAVEAFLPESLDADSIRVIQDRLEPPFFRVTLDEESKDPATLAELRNALAREDFFEEVQAPVEWVEKIAAWKFRMVFWPICISVLLLFILSLIICNSVRLSLFSRRLLVENMKYAGGSHFFIEFPFVMQGVVQGVVGSGLAVLLVATVVRSVADAFPIVAANLAGLGLALVVVVLLVTVLSGYFSFRTVRGFLSVKRGEQE